MSYGRILILLASVVVTGRRHMPTTQVQKLVGLRFLVMSLGGTKSRCYLGFLEEPVVAFSISIDSGCRDELMNCKGYLQVLHEKLLTVEYMILNLG